MEFPTDVKRLYADPLPVLLWASGPAERERPAGRLAVLVVEVEIRAVTLPCLRLRLGGGQCVLKDLRGIGTDLNLKADRLAALARADPVPAGWHELDFGRRVLRAGAAGLPRVDRQLDRLGEVTVQGLRQSRDGSGRVLRNASGAIHWMSLSAIL
ncbi:MAG TPA: hypothetical protein VGA56_03965 [Opitutaceae bacterium]